MINKKSFKVITYNIDGLPESIDLNDLPLALKPVAWIYKLFNKTTVIPVNDNTGTADKILRAGVRMSENEADIIGVQEDFNYHKELAQGLSTYQEGTHTGEIGLSKLFSSVKWFPYPRIKADGLNLFTRIGDVSVRSEEIVPWEKSYGYFNHGNDKLAMKGFRFYDVTIHGELRIGVYVVHMDADFYDPVKSPDVTKDVEARASQLDQLCNHIIGRYDRGMHYPVILLGDFNCNPAYVWDIMNIQKRLFERLCTFLTVSEVIADNGHDVDRIFLVNDSRSMYELSCLFCHYDSQFSGMSDHLPLIAEIKYEKR